MKKLLFLCLFLVGCEFYTPEAQPIETCAYTSPITAKKANICSDACCTWETYEDMGFYSVTCLETWCCNDDDCTWDLEDLNCDYHYIDTIK